MVDMAFGCIDMSRRNPILNGLLRSVEVGRTLLDRILHAHPSQSSSSILVRPRVKSLSSPKSSTTIGYVAFRVLVRPLIRGHQAIIDGPTTSVPRQAFPYRHLSLTPLRLTNLPRGARSGIIRKYLEREGTVAKWDSSAWAKRRAAIQKRRSLNDFARFEVMLAKKARRDVVRKALAKA